MSFMSDDPIGTSESYLIRKPCVMDHFVETYITTKNYIFTPQKSTVNVENFVETKILLIIPLDSELHDNGLSCNKLNFMKKPLREKSIFTPAILLKFCACNFILQLRLFFKSSNFLIFMYLIKELFVF